MPPRLREEFKLPVSTTSTRLKYQTVVRTARLGYPRLPDRMRYLPAYFEAKDRLAGKKHSDVVTRKLNLFWTGREELVSRDAWT